MLGWIHPGPCRVQIMSPFLLPLLLLAAAPQSPSPAPAALPTPLGYWNGPDWIPLRVDPSRLGVRFEPRLSESAVRDRIRAIPGLARDRADRAVYFPGHTVYLDTAPGTSSTAATRLAARIREMDGVMSASPRLLAGEEPYFLTEEILVRWRPGTSAERIHDATVGLRESGRLAYTVNPGVVYRVPHGADPLAIANRIYQNGDAEFAVPDFQLQRVPLAGTNDPLFPQQWHLESTGQNGALPDADIDASGAWDLTRGDPSVSIAVIDTGVELQHPDLRDNLLQGVDVLDDDWDPQARDYFFGLFQERHATSVCGVAAGDGNNGIGISGVAQQCTIIPIRFLSEYILVGPTAQDEVDAFTYACQSGASVINNSWGPIFPTPLPAATQAAIDDCVANGRGGLGTMIFFAAGNSGSDNSGNGYVTYPKTISVTACTDQAVLASYSSFGWSTDVCAPSNGGVNEITTTDRLGGKGYSSGDYTDRFGGTSSASPTAAGTMLLILSENPGLTWFEAKAVLLTTAEKIDPAGGNYDSEGHSVYYGYGRVNAAAAVAMAARVDSIQLSGPGTVQTGSGGTWQIGSAPPNASWYLFASDQLGGAVIAGQPLDLGGAPFPVAHGTTDSSGAASWSSGPLDPALSGRSFYLEAAVLDGGVGYDSDALQVTIQ